MPNLAKPDASLNELLTGQRDPHGNLATKLAVGHLRQIVRQRPSTVAASVAELSHYYVTSDCAERGWDPRQNEVVVKGSFLTGSEAASLIKTGVVSIIAGDEEMLAALPRGNWIGGTTAYFMIGEGESPSTNHLFCSVIRQTVACRIAILERNTLAYVTTGRFQNGFTYLLLPGFSEVHFDYALEAPTIPRLFAQPTMGWITGVHLSDIGKRTPKVFDGRTGAAYANAGVVLHVELPSLFTANLNMVNPFIQGDGPAIVFPTTGFTTCTCTIDGESANLAEYLVEHTINARLPLVANYAGAMVNVSIQEVDSDSGEVRFYAPVVAGETYRLARRRADYTRAIVACARSVGQPDNALACDCILNNLEVGLSSGGFVGPKTFGEIAYILLNQSLVVLNVGTPVLR